MEAWHWLAVAVLALALGWVLWKYVPLPGREGFAEYPAAYSDADDDSNAGMGEDDASDADGDYSDGDMPEDDGDDMVVAASSAAPRTANTNAGMKPERLRVAGRTHFFQLPPGRAPAGTLAVFPGCARSAQGFWPYDAKSCPECTGFPEDVSHTKQALARGYAVLVLTPQDQKSLCWSQKRDFPDALATLEKFLGAHGLMSKPLYLLGASSGGGISLGMASYAEREGSKVRVSGVIQEVSTRSEPRVDDKTGRLVPARHPPVVWIVMERTDTEKKAALALAALLKKHGVAGGVAASPPRKITPDYFADRIPAVTPSQSRQIVAALRKIGQISADGTVLSDPKESKWDAKLRKMLPMTRSVKTLSLAFRRSALWQAMTLAYGKHEHTADYTTAALAWFEGGARGDFSRLAAALKVKVPAALTVRG